MANEFDYFPFWPDDFIRDTIVDRGMTPEQIGAYMLLLCRAWHEKPVGSLPPDESVLSRYARCDSHAWARVRDSVLSCFVLRSNRYHQKRMRSVWQNLKNRKSDKSAQASAAAKGRWRKEKHANALPTHYGGNAKRNETKLKTTTVDVDAVAGELDRDEQADALLDAEGFPAHDPIRSHEFAGLAQIRVAQQNADYLHSVGQLGDRRGYIVSAIRNRYALLDAVGRQQTRQDRATHARAQADAKAKEQAEERRRNAHEKAEIERTLSGLSEPQLVKLKYEVIEEIAAGPGRTTMEKADPRTSPALRQAMYARLASKERKTESRTAKAC